MASQLFDRRERNGARAKLHDGSVAAIFGAAIERGLQIARIPYLRSIAPGDAADGAMAQLNDFRQRIGTPTNFDADRAIERNRRVHIGTTVPSAISRRPSLTAWPVTSPPTSAAGTFASPSPLRCEYCQHAFIRGRNSDEDSIDFGRSRRSRNGDDRASRSAGGLSGWSLQHQRLILLR
jgi:hypothetical protein